MQRSPELSLWGGLWELPRATRQDGEALEQCAARAVCESVGVAVQGLTPFGHRSSTSSPTGGSRCTGTRRRRRAGLCPPPLGCARLAWVTREALAGYALATPQVKLTELLWRHEAQGRLEF